MVAVNRPPTVDRDLEYRDLVARLRARRAVEAEAIAEGGSDIVYDEPPTEAQRKALGLDRGFFDEADEAAADAAARDRGTDLP
jgi:hypothetical protein